MVCLLWLLVCLVGWLPVYSQPNGHDTEVEKAQALTEAYWEWHLREFPEFGTEIGISDHDDKVTEHTEESFERRARNATQFLKEVNDINHSLLDRETRTNLLVMEDSISTFVEGFRFRFLTAYQRFQMGRPNPVSEWNYILSRQVFHTEEDYNRLLTRYSLIPRQFEQLVNLTAQAMKRGYMRNVEGIDLYSDALARYMLPPKDTVFYRPFLKMPSTIAAEKGESLQERAESIIQDKLLPAIMKMWFFVSKAYAEGAKHVPIGLYGLSDGRELYRRYLNYHLSLPMTPEQVHQLGLAEIQKVKSKIAKLQQDLNYTGSIRRFVQSFVDDPKYYFNDSESMIESYGKLASRIHGKLNRVLPYITDRPYVIHPSYTGPPGAYTEALDEEQPSIFYANVRKPYGPNFTMPSILLHETMPGHHTEATYHSRKNTTLPRFRRTLDFTNSFSVPFHFPKYSAYLEGWATYAESLGDILGVYDDEASLLGSYMSELLRACRLVVDTGIHAYGWTRQAAEEYLGNHTYFSAEEIRVEVSRYIGRPGQACSYKIGQMKILELRTNAQKVLGKHFDLRRFHHKLLSLGPVPLQLLEEEIHSWISASLAQMTEDQRGDLNTHNISNTASAYSSPCFCCVFLTLYTYVHRLYHQIQLPMCWCEKY